MNHAIYHSSFVLSLLAVYLCLPAGAQGPPDIPDPVEESLPGSSESLEPLPELPSDPEDPVELEEESPPTPAPEAVPPVSFWVEAIQVEGNTIFHTEIDALVSELEGREVTLEELLALRTDITNLYVEAGYISSGAFVPTNQVLDDGVVQIQVLEGAVEQIQINGLGHLREEYVRDRLIRATKPPLNVRQLEEALQLLQVDPLLQSVDAELTAGSGPGRNVLILDLAEADPFFL